LGKTACFRSAGGEIEMYFDSLQHLIWMNGHGVYVWLSFAISAVVMIGLIVIPLKQKQAAMKNIELQIKLQASQKASTQKEVADAPHS
jgi:heme exporter protein D